MKIETYLNAMVMCVKQMESINCGDTVYDPNTFSKRNHQYRVFYNYITEKFNEQEQLREIDRKIFVDIDRKLVALKLEGLWLTDE